jgi:hypothetical protein
MGEWWAEPGDIDVTDCVFIDNLVHEVTTVHFISVRDHAPEAKLNVRCGGYVTVPREYDWRWDGIVTCFWCIADRSRHRMDIIELKCTI